MRKYKKKPDKLLQIRLSKSEYDNVTDFMKRFNVTYREFMLSVANELEGKRIIKDGYFKD